MKLYSLFVTIYLLIANSLCDFQNLQTDDKQLNISSPLVNGVYVTNRTLPCTYTPANPANLKLNIYLTSTSISGFNETVIAADADISNDPTNTVPITQGTTTYYQHSVNYQIPPTTPAGQYQVIYQNVNTNSNTSIPITIQPEPVVNGASSGTPSEGTPSLANTTV
ncbi:hypothetical protein RMATCC62417_17974 [Rhizopus microsporus]|nr:hypothetical protein RMATCC62417_17974 [Rhizopus microsporus]